MSNDAEALHRTLSMDYNAGLIKAGEEEESEQLSYTNFILENSEIPHSDEPKGAQVWGMEHTPMPDIKEPRRKGKVLRESELEENEQVNAAIEKVSGLIKMNKFREAIRNGEKFLNSLPDIGLTRESPLLRDLYISLGIAYANVNDRKAAESNYRAAIDVAIDGDYAVCMWLVNFYLNIGSVEPASALCDEYLDNSVRGLGERDPVTLGLMRLKGRVLFREERYQESREILEKCYAHHDAANSDNELIQDLLMVLLVIRDLKRAYEVASFNYAYLKAGAGEPSEVALIGLKLAQIVIGMEGDLDRAYELLTESLSTCEKSTDPLQLAEVLVTMAHVRRRRNQYDDDTLELLNRAHECYETTEGPDHPNTRFTLRTIQKMRKQQYAAKFGVR